MSIYTIYKITNRINGKGYIGFDSNWPKRKERHIQETYTFKNKWPLYRAMRKYGIENFDWEILYQGEDGEYTLNVMENNLIAAHMCSVSLGKRKHHKFHKCRKI